MTYHETNIWREYQDFGLLNIAWNADAPVEGVVRGLKDVNTTVDAGTLGS